MTTEEYEEKIVRLKAELWVSKDSQLRTYDGMAQRADMADKLAKVLESEMSVLEVFLPSFQGSLSKIKQVLKEYRGET